MVPTCRLLFPPPPWARAVCGMRGARWRGCSASGAMCGVLQAPQNARLHALPTRRLDQGAPGAGTAAGPCTGPAGLRAGQSAPGSPANPCTGLPPPAGRPGCTRPGLRGAAGRGSMLALGRGSAGIRPGGEGPSGRGSVAPPARLATQGSTRLATSSRAAHLAGHAGRQHTALLELQPCLGHPQRVCGKAHLRRAELAA